ncbi:hypothetical protein [Chryseobacterium pennipullorum]|uniref:Uncharacterized protein n=1 Tax=Chryseobacterium pennipullorum TaxID=2258963 RepID=A0A3D9APV1_9FLAO|nr:hypothetical protein [Chryseobacterium pennipullorum]REC43360.1 hypothetical protein DRF67_19355 [Chryseobacterium pennipullorum]
MKTKLTLKAYLPLLLLIVIPILFIKIIFQIFNDPYYENTLFPKIFLPGIFILSFLAMFFGEIKHKFISVEFTPHEIIIKRFMGLQTKSYKVSTIEGWKYSYLSARGGTYEYLYLYKNGQKVVKISQFYHKNYDEVKRYVKTVFQSLGYEKFSYIDEFKEAFK